VEELRFWKYSFRVVENCGSRSSNNCRDDEERPDKKWPGAETGDVMSLHINTEQIGDIAVLQCEGTIVRAQGLRVLEDAATSLSQPRVIVLDLSEVEMLDGGGLGTLAFLHNWSCDNGIQLKLVNPSKLVREMLELTGLTTVLHISSVDDVIDMFCDSDRAIQNVDRAAV
jgi:anti-anti-sigma factor